MEIGPWVVTKQDDAEKPYKFTKRVIIMIILSNIPGIRKCIFLLFIDQPFGAGMSPAYKDKLVINSD